jgi:molybdate transport system ATP-binding protein
MRCTVEPGASFFDNPVGALMLHIRIEKRFQADRTSGFRLKAEFNAGPGITILFGPSGAGKSTILDCIAGLQTPDSGEIRLGDEVLFDAQRRVAVPVNRRGLGYVFQSLALFPHLTVEQNVAYGLTRLGRSERRRQVSELLQAFHIAHLAGRRPSQVSGGERQRVALARTLVVEPRALLLDEPLAALDLAVKTSIIDDLRAWTRRRIPVLYVTHNREEVLALGEQILVVDNGGILARGTPHEVLRAPTQETLAQVAGFENIFEACVESIHEAEGTMTCRLGDSGVCLDVALTRVKPGTALRIAIRAGDIMVATQPVSHISARNVVPGRITDLTQAGTRIELTVDCGVPVQATVTPSARDSLQLAAGREVWLVVKSYSCHLVEARRNT